MRFLGDCGVFFLVTHRRHHLGAKCVLKKHWIIGVHFETTQAQLATHYHSDQNADPSNNARLPDLLSSFQNALGPIADDA